MERGRGRQWRRILSRDGCGNSTRPGSESAQLLNAQTEEIALVPNTTAGIGLVAEGFPWKEGDNAVLPDNEFPSNQYPWLNLISRGVEIRRVERPQGGRHARSTTCLPPATRRTRIVSVSWVGYASGWRIDLDAWAKPCIAAGHCCLSMRFRGWASFRSMSAARRSTSWPPMGTSGCWGRKGPASSISAASTSDLLRPVGVGWNSVAHDRDFTRIELNYKDTAERYEGGTMNMAGFIGLNASLELLLQHGQQAISQRVLEITDLACRAVVDGRGHHREPAANRRTSSGIVSFRLPGRDPDALRNHCKRARRISCRAGRLRISPHAYNDESDIERLVDALG